MTYSIKILITNLLLIFIVMASKGQNTLTINVINLNSNKGAVVLELSDSNKTLVKGVTKEINNYCSEITIEKLPTGHYSFRYFHDINNNENLDTRFFIPKEGFGFSNNATGKFGPPDHEETLFWVENDTTVTVKPVYY